MKKIAVLNNKGGVGKSTISVQLSHGLAKLGFSVLLIDLDGQNDSSLFLGFSEDSYKKSFYDLLDKRNPAMIYDCIINARDNLDLLPSNHIEEINAEFHRASRIDLLLREHLKDLETLDYDYLIIDCGPQRTKINDAVLCYIDNIVMPVQVEAASVRAVGNIYEYLSDLRLSPVDIVEEGINKVFVSSEDINGNIEDFKPIEIKIDKTKPEITTGIDFDKKYLLNDIIRLDFYSTDQVSVIKEVYATFNGIRANNGAEIVITKPGINTIEIFAEDNAGNIKVLQNNITVDVPVNINITPKTINLKDNNSNAVITMNVTFPQEVDITGENVTSIKVNGITVPVEKANEKGKNKELILKVKRAELFDILSNSDGNIEIIGFINDYNFIGKANVHILKH